VAVLLFVILPLLTLAGCIAAPTGAPPVTPTSAQTGPAAPSAAGAILAEAQAALERGDLQAAEKAYRSAAEADPKSADAQVGLGNVLVQMGRPIEAEQALLAALRLDPNRAAAHTNLGVVYYQQGEMEKAAKAFSDALSLDDADAATTYLLAAVRLQQNDLPGAEKLLLKAQKLDPNLPEVYYGLGVLHRLKGEREQAIMAFRKYLAIGPGQDPAGMDYARKELEALGATP
jgi:tetratricopeptide (TPR) repeat protein